MRAPDIQPLREDCALPPPAGPGATCRYCGGHSTGPAPVGVILGDGTAAHHACLEDAEVERLLAAGQRAVAGVTATTDEGEMFHAGDEP